MPTKYCGPTYSEKMYKNIILISALFFLSACSVKTDIDRSFFDLHANAISGEHVPFEKYKGNVVLVANTALKCGTTPQFADLQELYEMYQDKGFIVLAFPSNDFTGREPEYADQIKESSVERFGVTFPLFKQGPVTGDEIHDVFSFLTDQKRMKGRVKFNFEKFLIDRKGKVRKRYGSFTGATSRVVKRDIEELLAESGKRIGND